MVAKKQKGVRKSSAKIKEDLEVFEKGIVRLKELDGELKALDTRGFYAEEKKIRDKLKNVSDIPLIEKEIKSLRFKINNKHKPKVVRKSPFKKIGRDLEDVREELPTIKKSIRRLSEKIDETKKIKGRVDSGVGVLVDSDFNDFLSDIKFKLSDRIKSREKEVDDVLRADLQKREEKFRDRYEGLVREFNEKKRKLEKKMDEKYTMKVRTDLQREVSEKFNKKLKEKLDSEKVELGKKYREELKLHAMEHLNKSEQELREKFQSELDKKVADLEKREQKEKEELGIEEEKLRESAKESKEKFQSELDKKVADLEKREQKEKEELGIEEEKLRESREKFVIQKKEEEKRIRERLSNEFHDKLQKELAVKEKSIRARLSNEFDLNLKRKIEEHESDLKKRKVALEVEIQRKMRRVLE